MSDLMFYGVLRMPYEMAMGSEISRLQFYARVQEAADRVEKAERALAASTPVQQDSLVVPAETDKAGSARVHAGLVCSTASSDWISSADRLPADGVDVLISGPLWDDYTKGRFAAVARLHDGRFTDDNKEEDDGFFNWPSHWMPLPAPPSEQTSSATCGGEHAPAKVGIVEGQSEAASGEPCFYTFTKPEGWINLMNPGQSWDEWTKTQGLPTAAGWRVFGSRESGLAPQGAQAEPGQRAWGAWRKSLKRWHYIDQLRDYMHSTYGNDPDFDVIELVPEGKDSEDAARYRWLRGTESWGIAIYDAIGHGEGEDLDAAIDAARADNTPPQEQSK